MQIWLDADWGVIFADGATVSQAGESWHGMAGQIVWRERRVDAGVGGV